MKLENLNGNEIKNMAKIGDNLVFTLDILGIDAEIMVSGIDYSKIDIFELETELSSIEILEEYSLTNSSFSFKKAIINTIGGEEYVVDGDMNVEIMNIGDFSDIIETYFPENDGCCGDGGCKSCNCGCGE